MILLSSFGILVTVKQMVIVVFLCFLVQLLGTVFLHLAPISDGYPFLRMPNEYLSNEDISYLMRGLTGIPSSNYGYDSDSCSVNNNDLDKPFAFDRQDLLGWLFS